MGFETRQAVVVFEDHARFQVVNVNVERLAEDLDFELEVQLQVGLLVQFGQHVHQAQRPRIGRLEHFTLGARLEHFGDKRHDVQQLLLAFVVRLDDNRLKINISLKSHKCVIN